MTNALPESAPGSLLAEVSIRDYWVPHKLPDEIIRHLENILAVDGEKHSLAGANLAVRTFIANLEAIHKYLLFPFTFARTLMDGASVPAVGSDPVATRMEILGQVFLSPEINNQLQTIKRQAVILLWSAYETFSRDIFVSALNCQHDLYERLLRGPLKEKFSGNGVFTYAALSNYGLNLEGKFGAYLAEGKDFSSPTLLRSLFVYLFSEATNKAELQACVESGVLWKLGNMRHLIAHRAGVVDAQYISKSGDAEQKIGSQIIVHGHEIDEAIRILGMTVINVLLAWDEEVSPKILTSVAAPAPQSDS